jgi:hypothetical protein
MRLYKDPDEPLFYLLPVEGDVTVALTHADVAHAEVRAAPAGASVEYHDNRALLETVPLRVARHVPLDQALVMQPSLLRGLVRTMPGLLKRPGCGNLFVELESEALGYKRVAYISNRSTLDALHFIGAAAAIGGRSYFEHDVFAALEARAFIDANLIFPEARLQSDAAIGGRFTIGFVPQSAELFWQTSWLGTRDERDPEWTATVLRHFGGVMVTLF